MPSLRPCTRCGRYVRGKSRCDDCGGQPFAGARERYVRFPEKVRKAVLARDGYRCVACGSSSDLQVDHIVPHSRGGKPTITNGRTLCKRCHQRHTGETFGFGGTLR